MRLERDSRALQSRGVSDELERIWVKTKLIPTRHPEHERHKQHGQISSSSSGKELARELLASPECEGIGTGLAKPPEGPQLLMCEEGWLENPNLPMTFLLQPQPTISLRSLK